MGIRKNKYFFRRLKWPWANRKYKDRVFRLLFKNDKKALLELYNAINHSDYKDPDELIINTLDNAIFMGMHNDLSFIIGTHLSIYEHQSTKCINMPIRCLLYVGRLYQQLIDEDEMYGKKLIRIPEPHFVVFYNGTDKLPEEITYKLSDMYESCSENPELELKVRVLNINQGMNDSLLRSCNTLCGYSIFVAKVREFSQNHALPVAINMAIDHCIEHDILKDFFMRERKAVFMYSLYEYNQDGHMKVVRQEGFEEGIEQGLKQGLEQGSDAVNRLNKVLIEANRMDDLVKAANDREYQKKLIDELL